VVVGGWFVWFGLFMKGWVGGGEVFWVWIMVFWIVLVKAYEVGKWEEIRGVGYGGWGKV